MARKGGYISKQVKCMHKHHKKKDFRNFSRILLESSQKGSANVNHQKSNLETILIHQKIIFVF
jgi:hypothetical protein